MVVYKPLDILFYKGDSIVSKAIKLISRSKFYSHCAPFVDPVHVLETSWRDANIIYPLRYRDHEYDVFRLNIDITPEQEDIVLSFLTEQLNIPYDYLYIFTRALNFIFGTPIRNTKGKFTCDELIVVAFGLIGIDLIGSDRKLTPEALSESEYLTRLT